MFEKEFLVIEIVTDKNIDEVLSLVHEYQVFYGVEKIDDEKNKSFFSQFTKSHENGGLHLCRVNQKAIGFTIIYKGYSSTRAEVVAALNDLYVQPQYRGNSYGKELITNALKTAKEMGFSRLQWLTAEDNQTAQKLYNSLGANKSSWFFYTKDT